MNLSYEEILEEMKDAFYAASGIEADDASDVGIRMRVLAGELFSLNSRLGNIRRQMFPNTATGVSLDRHAQQRGLERKKGQKAIGGVTFRVDDALDHDLLIPEGTVVTTIDGALNYITTADAILRAGSVFVYAPVTAENSGERYNSGNNTIKAIVTYFSVGLRIAASSDLWGGTDDEDDESLRKRLFESYRNTPDGLNAAFYESVAESVEGVQSAKAYVDANLPGKVIIAAAGRGEAAGQEALDAIQTAARSRAPIGITVIAQAASLSTVNVAVSIDVKDGYDSLETAENAEFKIRWFFDELRVGENFLLSELGRALLEVDGVRNYSFSAGTADAAVNNGTLAVAGTVTVTINT